MLKLIKSLTITLGQEFRNQLHTNFLRIEDFVNKLTKDIDEHKTTEKNAHNSEQISDEKFGNVKDGLNTINKRYSNIVVSKSKGNNILEVKDARVDKDGVDHDTLFDRLLSDNLKYGMDKEEIMTAVEDAKQKVLAQEFAFDIPNQSWQYLTNLSPFRDAVMQSFHLDNKTGLIYMTQVFNTDEDSGYRLSKLSSNGQVISQMNVQGGGHGTHNAYRWIDNKFWIYSFMKDPDGFSKIVRFTFRDNVTLTYGDYDMEEVFTGHPELPYITPIINEELGQILYRIQYPESEWSSRGSMNYIEIRNLSDVDKGIDKVLFKIDIPMRLTDSKIGQPMQGVTFDHEYLYWYTGDSDPAIQNFLTVFNLKTGKQEYQKVVDIGKTGNEFPGNFAEAEGLQMYYDKGTGKRALLAGVTVGTGNYRSHQIHGIFMRDVYDKLTAMASPVLSTETGGRTKTFPIENFNKISDIMEPGYYYMTTNTTLNLTDFPLPKEMRDAGWHLEVSAPNVAGDVKQTLTRNSYARDLMIFQRMVSINKFSNVGSVTNWNHVKSNSMGGPAEQVPSHITNMNQLGIVANKQWYCDTAKSSQIKDHPRPGIAGWTIDVENITAYAFKLTVTRVTSSAAVEFYVAYFSNTSNSRSTPWTKFTGENI
ncbi:minor structural protein [Staphylococcus phage SpP]